ncbi:MAG: glycosyltransferase family 2 protein [Bdellovibrionales bacterium]|nr:glycosyltransferase family 2 protein [Bdellovibrionales bacterium]
MGNLNRKQVHLNTVSAALTFALILGACAIGSGAVSASSDFVKAVVGFYISLLAVRSLLFLGGYAMETIRSRSNSNSLTEESTLPLISVLVPAYNEETVVADCIDSLSQQNYPNFEIIVVDDGSTDETIRNARMAANSVKRGIPVQVLGQDNAGKASALNLGIDHARGDYIFCMDADSKLHPGSFRHGMKHFSSNRANDLAAVAGRVVVGNQSNWLSRFQELDYKMGHFQRDILGVFSKVSIVPGPVGLFKKSAVQQVGGYDGQNSTFAEDTELTLRLLSYDFKVVPEAQMIAFTEAPTEMLAWARQRYRWSRGLYQALTKNFDELATSTNAGNSVLLLFLMWEQVFLPVLEASLVAMVASAFLFSNLSTEMVAGLIAVTCNDLVLTYFASQRSKRPFKWIIIALASRFSYSMLSTTWKIVSLFEEWNFNQMDWDKLQRNGMTNSPMRRA